MSCHHSQKSINLHHKQVNAGQARREQHQDEREYNFLAIRKQLRSEYNFMLVCGFICCAYTLIATAVYTGYILGA